MEIAIVMGLLIALIFSGLWIQMAVGVSAVIYIYLIQGVGGLKALGIVSWGSAESYTLSAIPLFVFMAEILLGSGLSTRLYSGISPLIRKLPGGLLHTNVVGCGLFAAVSGGSAPTAAAMGTVALPELGKKGYNRKLAAGSLAAGGTLGILIPPSITFIVYSMFTDTSIAQLFMAGVVPGIVLMLLYMAYIAIRAFLQPELAPAHMSVSDEKVNYRQCLFDILPLLILIIIVLGSIYGGIATPTEAGAIGTFGAIIIARMYKSFTFEIMKTALRRTLVLSGNVLFIVFVSMIFAYATARSGVGEDLVDWFQALGLSQYQFLFGALVFYGVLGCFMEGLGMIAITVPILYPTLVAYGIDPIWFGVYIVILVELGQLTPPLGVILFVVASTWEEISIEEVVLGVLPFYLIIVAFVFLLIFFPDLALWFPRLMIN
ncbi:TRAP transporter large permease [Pelobacter seleniigenes]|uniref:TRAP transporter large permease n=1 Tax=Pelobacter seleniigenes TaxID=407188 RepID=UPI0004A75FE3|nr:TRAP transporter large permease [Pelobacter seleniigenes]